MQIVEATVADWEDIRRIYIEGILTNNATFEIPENVTTDGESWFDKKVSGSILKAVDENGRIVGWAGLSPVSARTVYRGVGEVSVYISNEAKGKGVGKLMLKTLVDLSESLGFWTLQASIFPENEASIHIHKTQGFRIVGTREKIAQHYGVWRDTTFMERRSKALRD